MADLISKDDIGVEFRASILQDGSGVNIASATTKKLIFKKPTGNTLTVTASFYTNGSDGVLSYISTSGDLNEAGLWRLQGHIILGTNNWKTEISPFFIYPNIE